MKLVHLIAAGGRVCDWLPTVTTSTAFHCSPAALGELVEAPREAAIDGG